MKKILLKGIVPLVLIIYAFLFGALWKKCCDKTECDDMSKPDMESDGGRMDMCLRCDAVLNPCEPKNSCIDGCCK